MNRYNNGMYLAANPSWHAEDAPFKASNIKALMKLAGLNPKTIVEVGCGAGGVVADIARTYTDAQCIGYDVSPDAVSLCAAHSAPNLRYVLGSFAELGSHADVVISCDVLEHVDDYLGFIRHLGMKAHHVLMNIPLEICVASVLFRKFGHSRSRWGHLHYFTKETAIASVQHAGLIIERHFLAMGGVARARSLGQKLAAVPRLMLLAVGRDFSSMILGGCSLVVHARGLRDAATLGTGPTTQPEPASRESIR